MLAVRPATPRDADAIAAILVAGWRAAYRGIVDDALLDALDETEPAARWRDLLPDVTAFVAIDDDEIVGVVALAVPARELGEPATGEVTALYVHPDHWRRGAGRMLMDVAAAELRDQGCREVVLWVFEANEIGRAFYDALGFIPDGGESTHADRPEIRLRAPLTGVT